MTFDSVLATAASNRGPKILQGGHHVAVKSTMTGIELLTTFSVKSSWSWTVKVSCIEPVVENPRKLACSMFDLFERKYLKNLVEADIFQCSKYHGFGL